MVKDRNEVSGFRDQEKLDVKALELAVLRALRISARIGVADAPVAAEMLSANELVQLRRFKSRVRRENWLVGRNALKSLLRRLGESDKTSEISFPNPRFSLTHSGEFAIAAGVSAGLFKGIGVDFQVFRSVSPRMARFYLTDREEQWVMGTVPFNEKMALRLWSIKEAVFKANPKNHGTFLREYRLFNPEEVQSGTAVAPGERTIEYISIDVESGFFSFAVLR